VFVTRSFNITPKTTVQNIIVCGDRSEVAVTNNTRCSAVAERPRDASCLSFNILLNHSRSFEMNSVE